MLHSGHEFVLCLEGELEYEVEDQRYILMPGDSLLFAANLRHRWRNASKVTTRAVIALTCFERGESPSEFHFIPEQLQEIEEQA
jgi:quercetin dioxygenase-like cupin family protein